VPLLLSVTESEPALAPRITVPALRVSGVPFAERSCSVTIDVSRTGSVVGDALRVELSAEAVSTTSFIFPGVRGALEAVISTVPSATAVTIPLALTVATAVLELDQVTVAPGMGRPRALRTVSDSWSVAPAEIWALSGYTSTYPRALTTGELT
jgi:hypothetical protein